MKIYLAINDGYISKPLGAYPSLKMAKFAVEFLRNDTKQFTQEELENYGPENLISAYWSSDGVISIWEVSFIDRETFVDYLSID